MPARGTEHYQVTVRRIPGKGGGPDEYAKIYTIAIAEPTNLSLRRGLRSDALSYDRIRDLEGRCVQQLARDPTMLVATAGYDHIIDPEEPEMDEETDEEQDQSRDGNYQTAAQTTAPTETKSGDGQPGATQ